MSETITETTVANLSGIRIGVANIGRGDYTLPDGSNRVGLSASLFFPDDTRVNVGPGSIVKIGDGEWRITEVKKGWFEKRGKVTFEQIK